MDIRRRERYLWMDYNILENPDVTKYDLAVYIALARFVNNETQECYPSYSKIAELSRTRRTTVSKCLTHLEELGLISISRGKNKVNHYTLLSVSSPTDELVQKGDSGSPKGIPQVVHSGDTNNTNITSNKNEGKYQAKYYALDSCSRGVKYAVEKLKLRPTESLVTIIDEQFKDYAVAPSINTMLAWCETKGATPTTATLAKWLKRDLDSGVLKEKRRS